MPRVSKIQTQQNRETIEKVSSRLIRERGLSVSVADLMNSANLTHGGFYGHFKSKDELNAIACANAFSESTERWKQRVTSCDNPQDARDLLINSYLSPLNDEEPYIQCPMATLCVDVARESTDKPVRESFHKGLEDLIGVLTSVQPDNDKEADARETALAQIAAMVGALVLSQATKGYPVSEEILSAARDHLLK